MIIGISGKIGSGKDTIGEIIQHLVWASKNFPSNVEVSSFETIKKHRITFEENKKLSTFEIKKFADKLKDIVCLLIGCTREQLEDHEFKNKELGEEWIRYAYAIGFGTRNGERIMWSNTCSKEKYEEEYRTNWQTAYKTVLTPRILLQLLGTECGRNTIHTNIWVNSLFSDYKDTTTRRMDIIDFSENEHRIIKGKEYEVEDSYLGTYPNWIITDMRFPNELQAIKDRKGITIRVRKDIAFTSKGERVYLPVEEYNKLNNIIEHESETALDNANFDYVIDNNGSIEDLVKEVRKVLIKENIIHG